jgi:heme A synthase
MIVGCYLSPTIDEKGRGCHSWPLILMSLGCQGYISDRIYIQRVFAAVTTDVVYAAAIAMPSSIRKTKLASILPAVVVSIRIILGYFMVTTGLYPFIVAAHLSTGITVFAFGLIIFLWMGILSR